MRGFELDGQDFLTINGLSKEYSLNGSGTLAGLDDISLGVRRGEFVSIVGPSGSGKTTLLMCVAGLMSPTRGCVLLDGKPVASAPQKIVMVFQNYAASLLPWRTALGNVMLALEHKVLPRREKRKIAEGFLESVGLDEFKGHYPWQLSGGLQQRVAIARALAYGSEVILLDEPFASLDALARFELEDFLLQLWQEYNRTILFVTHDIDEAIYLSDTVVVLSRRPASIQGVVPINIERPRNQLRTRGEVGFAEFRSRIWSMIRMHQQQGNSVRAFGNE